MYLDLNFQADTATDVAHLLHTCHELGYAKAAQVHKISNSISGADRASANGLENGSSPWLLQQQSGQTATSADGSLCHDGLMWGPANRTSRQPLQRLHIEATEPAQAQQMLTEAEASFLNAYDTISVAPPNERALQQACTALPVDIIQLDLSRRSPYVWKKIPLKSAIDRGIYFEITYGEALTTPPKRKHFFSNAQQLVRALNGKNIIITSGAQSAEELRSPCEVMHMAAVLGMSLQQAKDALSAAPRRVLLRAAARRVHAGAIFIHS
eukprot:jgi/Chrzof1/9403/Cz04g01210.t1